MFKSILLAVDGSIYTDSVLQSGVALAKAVDAKIRVITVLDIRVFEWISAVGSDGFVPMVSSGTYQVESQKLLEEKCDKVLHKCSDILNKENVKFKTEKFAGAPAQIICEQARLADLLILGRRGEFARWDSKMVGATIDTVSRHCNKPILMALQQYKPIMRILVAYDGSSNSNRALQYAGYLGAGLKVPITVISVNNDESLGRHYCEEAENYLKSYEAQVTTVVKSGNPDKEIPQYSKEFGADLLIIGAYGHSRIREAILGSTTQHILRLSTAAVLMIK